MVGAGVGCGRGVVLPAHIRLIADQPDLAGPGARRGGDPRGGRLQLTLRRAHHWRECHAHGGIARHNKLGRRPRRAGDPGRLRNPGCLGETDRPVQIPARPRRGPVIDQRTLPVGHAHAGAAAQCARQGEGRHGRLCRVRLARVRGERRRRRLGGGAKLAGLGEGGGHERLLARCRRGRLNGPRTPRRRPRQAATEQIAHLSETNLGERK